MLRFLWRFVAFLAEMNGYTPFFQALFKAYLAIIVGGLSVLSGWVCSVFGSPINQYPLRYGKQNVEYGKIKKSISNAVGFHSSTGNMCTTAHRPWSLKPLQEIGR